MNETGLFPDYCPREADVVGKSPGTPMTKHTVISHYRHPCPKLQANFPAF